MKTCRHEFSVDSACEGCGIMLSELVQDQQEMIAALRRLNQDQAARLRAYAGLMVMRPHKLLAVQGSDEAVLVPEPESLTQLIEEHDRLEKEVVELRRMLR